MDVTSYLAMAEGKPYKSFIKTINGKVYVTTLSISDETKTEGVILKGNQRKHEDSAIIDLWNEKQYQVFRKLNAVHIKNGMIVEYVRPDKTEEVRERTMAEWSDEELFTKVLKTQFQSFLKIINTCDNPVLLTRIYTLGVEKEISSKFTDRIVSRISEVQGFEFIPSEVIQ